jgi:hypothetical protein
MAGECLRVAQGASDPINKVMLLELAQTWARLAQLASEPEVDIQPSEPENE